MKNLHSQRGSLILLVLCFVAVVGIALASYLAVSTQAMKLSQRAYAKDVSKSAAEMGLERALRSFNFNTFSSWTLNGTTASQTFTVATARYGSSGLAVTVNVRVDNYNAFILDATWNNTTRYHVDQYVLYGGNWYRCNTEHSNQTPGGANWNTATGSGNATWVAGTYNIGDIVYRTSAWYRSLTANNSSGPPGSTWSTAPLLPIAWTSGGYNLNDIVYDRGSWYRCTSAHTSSQPPPNASYWASADTTSWSSATTYAVNDYVSYGGVWYRCIAAHTNKTPNNATYWTTNAPVIYAEGVVTLPDNSGTVKTQIRAVVDRAALFPNAAAAGTALTFSSGGTIDSYDSSRGSTTGTSSYNTTNSPYSVASPNLGSTAVLAGGNTGGTAVTLTSTSVKGYIAAPPNSTSPFAPRYSVGSTARLTNTAGGVTAPHPTAANVDLTRIVRSPYIPLPDVLTPNTGTVTALPSSTATLGSATDTTWRTYTATNLNITDSRVYTVAGPVRIVVTGYYYQNLSTGSASIVISNNSTARLEMYISGDVAFYGLGIDNQTRIPSRVTIYATTNNTAPDFNNSTAFYGTIYFSNTAGAFTVLNTPTIYGAIAGANNVTFSGSPTLHYDTSLRYTTFSGVDSPCILTQWREMTDPTEQITLP